MVNLIPCIEVYNSLKKHDGAFLSLWVALANQVAACDLEPTNSCNSAPAGF